MPFNEAAVATDLYTMGLGLLGTAAAMDDASTGHYLESNTSNESKIFLASLYKVYEYRR